MMMEIYFSKAGVMSADGISQSDLWRAVTEGDQSGIKKVRTCTGAEFFAAKINDEKLKKSSARYDMRIMRIEEMALDQIAGEIRNARDHYGADRVAVCVGSCDNGTEFSLAGHRKYFEGQGFPKDYSLEIQGADYVATFVAEKFGLKGPCSTFETACSSSAGAIIKGAELIMAGLADAVVVGGIDIASDTVLEGFNSLEAVSDQITNPFSKNRHGITIGEAGVFFVMTREPFDANPVKLLGWGESADAYHATSPDPSGEGAKKAMCRAMEIAGIKPTDVGYVHLHGTGTKFNDSMESKAINEIFGEYKVPLSSVKPVTGHTLGAAAAIGMAVCQSALLENRGKSGDKIKLPVQVWDEDRDPDLPVLNFISKKGKIGLENDKELKICLSNSFAFGGANACLVLGF